MILNYQHNIQSWSQSFFVPSRPKGPEMMLDEENMHPMDIFHQISYKIINIISQVGDGLFLVPCQPKRPETILAEENMLPMDLYARFQGVGWDIKLINVVFKICKHSV